MRCEREPCQQLAVATVHDRRGCRHLCIAHTNERLRQSFAFVTEGARCACGQLGTVNLGYPGPKRSM